MVRPVFIQRGMEINANITVTAQNGGTVLGGVKRRGVLK